MDDLTRTAHTLLLVLACVTIETAEQSLYRLAGRHERHWWRFIVPAGALHVAGLAMWYLLLRVAPLAVALPLLGLQYVTIAIAARVLFGERVDRRRWLAIALIVVGFALIALYSDSAA